MAMVIKPKRKFTAGAPSTSDLLEGEIAVNTADKKLYVRDNANNIIEIGGGGAGGSTTEVTQSSHGFVVKDAVRHNGTAWVKAQANNASTLALGIVVVRTDANNFTVAQSGRFELASHGLTVGQWYYVDFATAGGLTSTEPSFSQPIVYVESTSHLFVYPYRPTAVFLGGQHPTGIEVDEFTGNGSATAFTLGGDPINEKNTQVYIDGVYQEKGTYSTSGTTITFSTAPENSDSIEVVRYEAAQFTIGVPDNDSVTTAKIANAAVTTAKIADNAITTAKILNANVTTAKIADANVTTAKIADANVTTAKIVDGAITAAKFAAGAIGTASVGDNSITTAKVQDDAITAAKIADNSIDIARLNVSDGTTGQLLKTDGSGTLSFTDAPQGISVSKVFFMGQL
jgi:hypothetical protein